MMQNRNVISGTMASVLTPLADGFGSMTVWLLVAFVLIMVDLRFGIAAAKVRGEKIRKSRAVRRTVNKMVDYLCWISIAWVLGDTFGKQLHIPLLAVIVMAVVCLIELSSIFDNYFEAHGIHKKFNVFKFFSALFKLPDLSESMEEKEEKKKQ